MNASVRCAALVALCVGMAACAPRPYSGSYGSEEPAATGRYDGTYYSAGSNPTYYDYSNRGAYGGYSSGYYVAPPPPRSAYDPGPTYYEAYPRTYYSREYYPNTETGWYDRWGRWHPSRAY